MYPLCKHLRFPASTTGVPIELTPPCQHLTSYPVVADSIGYVQKNPYGARGIDMANSAYASLFKPILPFFHTPLSYTKPYVAKVDQLGHTFLTRFDETVPIVKSDTAEIKSTALDYAHWPFKMVSEGTDWITSTYSQEYKKCGGDGVVAGGKAAITSTLILSSDVLGWLSSFLVAKKEQAKDAVKEKTQQ
jgi:hypothetical protein